MTQGQTAWPQVLTAIHWPYDLGKFINISGPRFLHLQNEDSYPLHRVVVTIKGVRTCEVSGV